MHGLQFLLIGLMGIQLAFSKVIPPSGAERSVSSNDFHFHSSSGKNFNENWFYQFVFDNGTRAYVNFNRAKIPTKGLKTGVDITVKNFNGKNKQVGRQYPKERFMEDRTAHNLSIKSGKSLFYMNGLPQKGHQVHFETDKDGGYYLDITFQSAVPGLVVGDGTWKFDGSDDAKYTHFIHTPYAKVTGKIALGKDTLVVSGYAYMDHIVSSAMATETISKSYLMSSAGAHVAGRVGLVTKDYGRGHFGNMMVFRNNAFHLLTTEDLRIVKRNAEITASNWEEFKFKHIKSHGCYSPLDNIEGAMSRLAAKAMLGGKIIACPGLAKSHLGTVDYLKFHVD